MRGTGRSCAGGSIVLDVGGAVVKIPDFYPVNEQYSTIGKHTWSVARLIFLARDLPVMEIPINALSLWKKYDVTMRELITHMKAVLDADLSFQIILDEDGEIMDGRHRIMKVLLEGRETIKAVRFDENPTPCRIEE